MELKINADQVIISGKEYAEITKQLNDYHKWYADIENDKILYIYHDRNGFTKDTYDQNSLKKLVDKKILEENARLREKAIMYDAYEWTIIDILSAICNTSFLDKFGGKLWKKCKELRDVRVKKAIDKIKEEIK